MLSVTRATRLEQLVPPLVQFLRVLPDDPFESQTVLVPTEAVDRWLRQRLTRELTPSGRADGIVANVDFMSLGRFRAHLLTKAAESLGAGTSPVAWQPRALRWAVARALIDAGGHTDAVGARATRIAALLDRYHLHRPDMVAQWATGHAVDDLGHELSAGLQWQFDVWRRCRELIGQPSPAEVMVDLRSKAPSAASAIDLPTRLAIFGVNLMSSDVAQTLIWLSSEYAIDVFQLSASVVAASSQSAPRNRLLRSWGTDALRVVDELLPANSIAPIDANNNPRTVLQALQASVHGDIPTDDLPALPVDNSIAIHGCAGSMHQAEVARDTIWHLLQADPDLCEEDIAVLVPNLDTFEQQIRVAFAEPVAVDGGDEVSLRFRVASSAGGRARPHIDAFVELLQVLRGRSAASDVIRLCSMAPVQQRFGLSGDAVQIVESWRENLDIKWGIDADHRYQEGLPKGVARGSWTSTIDRLLLGAALTANDSGPDDTAPYPVAESDLQVAARVAALVGQLASCRAQLMVRRPVHEWCDQFAGWSHLFFDELPDDRDSAARLVAAIERFAREAMSALAEGEAHPPLDFADVAEALLEDLGSSGAGQPLYPGQVTVASLSAVRTIPFPVIVLMGFDDDAAGASVPPSDDLVGLHPRTGDPDRRSDQRQLLLDAIGAARSHLVITHNDRSPVTNAEVPASIALEELLTELDAIIDSDGLESRPSHQVRVSHPVLRYSSDHFVDGWSFDAFAASGATSRRRRLQRGPSGTDLASVTAEASVDVETVPQLFGPTLSLESLAAAVANPLRSFVGEGLQVVVASPPEAASDVLPTHVDSLDRWQMMNQLIKTTLGGGQPDSELRTIARSGRLPVGALGATIFDDLREDLRTIVACGLNAVGGDSGLLDVDRAEEWPMSSVEIDLAVGTSGPLARTVSVVGALDIWDVSGERSLLSVQYSKRLAAHVIASWVQLIGASAAGLSVPTAHIVYRGSSGSFGLCRLDIDEQLLADRRAANDLITRLVDWRDRAVTSPIPFFAQTSLAFADPGERFGSALQEWTGSEYSKGDGSDTSVRLVYGDLDFFSLESDTDFAVLAQEFWSMFESSCDLVKPVNRSKRGSGA